MASFSISILSKCSSGLEKFSHDARTKQGTIARYAWMIWLLGPCGCEREKSECEWGGGFDSWKEVKLRKPFSQNDVFQKWFTYSISNVNISAHRHFYPTCYISTERREIGEYQHVNNLKLILCDLCCFLSCSVTFAIWFRTQIYAEVYFLY